MKNRKLFLLPIILLVLTGCKSGKTLETPTLMINDKKTGLTWAPVANASGYEVKVNNGKAKPIGSSNIGYDFAEDVGTYSVSIIAKGGNGYADSKPAKFDYSTKETDLGNFRTDNGVITWGIFKGESLLFKEIGQEDYVTLDASAGSYTPTSGCIFEFYAKPGFNEQDNVFYVENPEAVARRMVAASPRATNTLIIEDGYGPTNSDLADKYKAYNENKNWAECSATATLSTMNAGYTDGKCVQYQFWHHGWHYMFETPITMDKAYDTISFAVKGAPDESLSLSFVIKQSFIVNTPIGAIDLAGARLSYSIAFENSNWTRYSVSLKDSGWIIKDTDLGDISINSVIGFLDSYGFTLDSVSDLCPLFNSFQLRMKAAGDSTGSNAYMYFDDIALSYTGERTSKETMLAIQESYAFRSDNSNGIIEFNEDRSQATVKYVQNEQQETLQVNSEIINGELHLTAANNALDLYLTTEDGGFTFTTRTASGTLANIFANAEMGVYKMLDDFESYTATGIGYDYNNPAENRSGMRANYYFDYYGGGSTSPLGGTNWDLMKSADYFDLYKTTGLYDSQCARVKHNRGAAMRYINYNLYDGSATAITNGGSLVFFAKGSDTEDVKIKIRAYMVNKVDKNNQITAGTVSTLFDDVTIHQNSGNYAGWQKYEFQLAANKTYYGFSITTIHNNGSGATYFYLDNIYVYSSVNPF